MSATTTKTAATAPKMPVFTTSAAMTLLWRKAALKLQTDELEWFADGAGNEVNTQTHSMADFLMALGRMVGSDTESGSFQDADDVSNLLYSLSHQLSTLNGLANIAVDANYLVRMAHEKAMYSGEN